LLLLLLLTWNMYTYCHLPASAYRLLSRRRRQ
jgi:hypothetical protein